MVKLSKSMFKVLLASVLGVLGVQCAVAQVGFPDKPISIHVGFPPGTSTDSIARILGEKMSKDLARNLLLMHAPIQRS